MLSKSIIYVPVVASLAAAQSLMERQDNTDSTCLSYGIDFVSGGDYFIDSLSNEDFTAVSQFSGCNDASASILLIDQSTSDEYECTAVPTVPDDVSQMSTCPIEKSEMSSGEWSVLIIGNNADGNPFAYERDFSLDVAPQETTTITPTITYTAHSTPSVNATTTSEIDYTSTVNNTLTVTQPATTKLVTIVPSEVTSTKIHTHWHTLTTWTATQNVVTHTETPACTVPPRPNFVDPWAKFKPTIIPIPFGLHFKRGETRAVDHAQALARLERHRARRTAGIKSPKQARNVVRRSADAATITSTALLAANTTSTEILPTSTNWFTEYSSNTITSTLPPLTVKAGVETDYSTAPTPTDIVHRATWSHTVTTSTLSARWTRTVHVTPVALATSCKRQGGHFGWF